MMICVKNFFLIIISDIFNVDSLTSQDIFILIMCAYDYDSLIPIIIYITSGFNLRVEKDK
jgi:hypothetical protein